MKFNKRLYFVLPLLLVSAGLWLFKNVNLNSDYKIGEPIDSLNNVIVYFNGGINHVEQRNLIEDGYNLGLEYQCVEFVKRYYYEHLNHKMPDTYGHAVDFFDPHISDGDINEKRGLLQFRNQGETRPEPDDIIVFKGTVFNRFGHVAIVSEVGPDFIEVIQQNPGMFGSTRENYSLLKTDGVWKVENNRVIGWLRKKKAEGVSEFEVGFDHFPVFVSGHLLVEDKEHALSVDCLNSSTYLVQLQAKDKDNWQVITEIEIPAFPVQFDLKFMDVNFDGINDVYIQKTISNGYAISRGYFLLMDRDCQSMSHYSAMDTLGNVKVDSVHNRVISEEAVWCAPDGSMDVARLYFKWENETLVFIKKDDPCED